MLKNLVVKYKIEILCLWDIPSDASNGEVIKQRSNKVHLYYATEAVISFCSHWTLWLG